MLQPKESSTDGSLLSTPGFTTTPEPIFTPIKDLVSPRNDNEIPYFKPDDLNVLDEIKITKRSLVNRTTLKSQQEYKSRRHIKKKLHRKDKPILYFKPDDSSVLDETKIIKRSSQNKTTLKPQQKHKSSKFTTNPKSLQPKIKAKMSTETKCKMPTTEQRVKFRTHLHELLVMKPMQQCTDANCSALKKLVKPIELIIEKTEKQLFEKLDTNELQYMITYRNLVKIFEKSTTTLSLHEKISNNSINAKDLVKMLCNHKLEKFLCDESKLSSSSRSAVKKKIFHKQSLQKSKFFNPLDLLDEISSGSAGSNISTFGNVPLSLENEKER